MTFDLTHDSCKLTGNISFKQTHVSLFVAVSLFTWKWYQNEDDVGMQKMILRDEEEITTFEYFRL